jgi:hypothetical protein
MPPRNSGVAVSILIKTIADTPTALVCKNEYSLNFIVKESSCRTLSFLFCKVFEMRYTMRFVVLASVISFVSSTPAFSEIFNVYQVPLPDQILRSNIETNYFSLIDIAENETRRKGTKKATRKSARKSTPTVATPRTSSTTRVSLFAFKPAAQRRQSNIDSFITNLIAANPGQDKQIRDAFGDPTLFSVVDKSIAPMGLSTENLADAFTIWWITNWETSRAIAGSVEPKGRPQAVQKQVQTMLFRMPSALKLSDEEKQDLADYLILQTVLINRMAEHAKQDPSQWLKVVKGIKASAFELGFDFDSMELTDTGFVPIKE